MKRILSYITLLIMMATSVVTGQWNEWSRRPDWSHLMRHLVPQDNLALFVNPGAQMIDGAKGNSQYPALKTSEEIVQNADFHDFTIDYPSVGEPDPFYESDFKDGTDGWNAVRGTENAPETEPTTGETNTLKYYASTEDGAHYIVQNLLTTNNQYYKVTGKVYIPSTNTNLKSVIIGSEKLVEGCIFIDTQDTWVDFEVEINHNQSTNPYMRIYGATASHDITFTGAGSSSDDIFYVKDIKVQKVGLIAWWQFDSYYHAQEGTGKTILQDLSGNGYDLTASGGFDYTNQLTGDDPIYKNGNALEFDGVDDYLLLSKTYTNVYSPQDHSMTYLFYFNSGVLGYDKNVFSALGSPGYAGLYIKSDGTLHFNLKDDDSNGKYVSICSVNENKDYLVICSYDENNNKLDIYVNGNLKQSISTSYTTFTFDSKFDIGKSAFYANGYFDCFLYNAALFNRALSATEVKALYGKPKYWTWNETGTITNNNFKAELSGGAELSQDITTDDETLYKEQKISTTANNVDYFGNTTSHTITIGDGTWTYAGVKDVTNVDAVGSNFVEDFSKGGAKEINNPVLNATNWVDNNGDGVPDYWSTGNSPVLSVVTGNGFSGNAQRIENSASGQGYLYQNNVINVTNIGEIYKIRVRYRSNVTLKIGFFTKLYPHSNTGNAVEYVGYEIASSTGQKTLYVMPNTSVEGDWVEIDEIEVYKVSNGNHGLAQGGLEANQPVFPYAWEFDGVDDYVDFGDVFNIKDHSAIIPFWFKTSSTKTYLPLFGKSESATSNGFTFYLSAGYFRLNVGDGTNSTSHYFDSIDHRDGEWYFGTLIYDSQNTKWLVYLDAEFVGDWVSPYTYFENTDHFRVGKFWGDLYEGQLSLLPYYLFDGQDGRASVMPSNYYQRYIQKIYNNTRRYFQ